MNRRRIALIGILCFLTFTLAAWGEKAAGDGPAMTAEVRVKPGDTLWSLARRHADNSVDVRDLISEIRRINQLEDAIIHPGQILKIPLRNER